MIYVGSFSKVLVPGLRLGFLVAPASLQPALQAARQLSDWHGDIAPQGALAEFIDSGALARHIRVVTREYEARYARIAEAIDRRFATTLRLVPASAGLHLAATFAPGVRVIGAAVVSEAATRGVKVGALAECFLGSPRRDGLVIGFGGIPSARIDGGLDRLADAMAAATRAR